MRKLLLVLMASGVLASAGVTKQVAGGTRDGSKSVGRGVKKLGKAFGRDVKAVSKSIAKAVF